MKSTLSDNPKRRDEFAPLFGLYWAYSDAIVREKSVARTYREAKLNSGVSVITCEDPNSEVVCFSFAVKGGSRYETTNESGYAHLLEHMMLRGTKRYPTAYEVSVVADRAGARLNGRTDVETIEFTVEVAKEKAEEMFQLLREVVTNPLIDPLVLENEKRVVFQEQRQVKSDRTRSLWLNAVQKMFKDSSVGNPVIGTEETVTAATADALHRYRERIFSSSQIAIIATGGISHERVVAMTADFRMEAAGAISFGASPLSSTTGRLFEKWTDSQTTLLDFFFPAPAHSLKDYLAMEVVRRLLAYGNSSLLYQELRHKRGFAYNVGGYQSQYRDASLFCISVFTTKPQETVTVVQENLFGLEEKVNEQLVRDVKEQTWNILARILDDPRETRNFLSTNWALYDRMIAPEEVKNVLASLTRADIMGMQRKVLRPDNLFLAVAGTNDISGA